MASAAETLEVVLETFKAELARDAAGLQWYQEDPGLRALVLAWANVPSAVRPKGGDPPHDTAARWAWLWSQYEYKATEWIELAGIADQRWGMRLVDRAIRLRLVLPDGTLPAWLQRFVLLQGANATMKLQPKPQRRPPQVEVEEEEEDDE